MKTSNSSMISKLSFGGASLGGQGGGYSFGDIEKVSALKLLDRAVDLGITSFDTAPIYGFGESELILGEGLRKHRDKVHIMTKGGVSWHSTKRVNMTNEPKVIAHMLEDSLKRLDLGYIDTYLLHYPDSKIDIRYPLDIIIKAKNKGLVKHIGLSNTHPSDISKAQDICELKIIQSECNLFNNEFNKLQDSLKHKDLITMGWGTLDKGILSSRVFKDRKYDESDFRSWAPWWKKSDWKQRVSKVNEFKKKYPELNLMELALSYSLSEVSSIICGAKNINDLEQLVSLVDRPHANTEDAIELWNKL